MALHREALEPLYQSIKKWQDNVRCTDIDKALTGQLTCPLCEVFYHRDCAGCPVAEETGQVMCRGTTYSEAHRAKDAIAEGLAPMSTFTEPAKKYLEFLEMLWRKR